MAVRPELVGGALGLALLTIAIGAWPAGVLADRIGPLPVRIVSVIGYASAFALLAVASWIPQWTVLVLLGTLGIFGAGLAPSMYMLAAQRQRGAVGMGGVQAAGVCGLSLRSLDSRNAPEFARNHRATRDISNHVPRLRDGVPAAQLACCCGHGGLEVTGDSPASDIESTSAGRAVMVACLASRRQRGIRGPLPKSCLLRRLRPTRWRV